MKREGLFAIILLLLVADISWISADISVSPTSEAASINQASSFAVTVANTFIDGVAPNNGTVTKIDITLPAGLLFLDGTNASNPSTTFSNTSNVLTWTNSSFAVALNGQVAFSFSANATALGSSTITVAATLANASVVTNTISVNASDTTPPVVNLIAPSANYLSRDGVFAFECTATDNMGLNRLGLRVLNSNRTEVYSNYSIANGTSSDITWDYKINSDGTYTWSCYANDTSGNSISAASRTFVISLSTSSCVANWTNSSWSECAGGIQTRTVADLNSCNVSVGKPATNQTCVAECAATWSCTGWNPNVCTQNKTQARACTNTNSCGNETNKPSETQSCEYQNSTGWIVLSGIAALLIGGIAVAVFFFLRSKSETELYPSQNSNEGSVQAYQGNNPSGYNYEYF